jgi:VCBS repeat-containing protein
MIIALIYKLAINVSTADGSKQQVRILAHGFSDETAG